MPGSRLKLLVTDIDGCLIQGEKAPYDFEALAAIRELNRAAERDKTIPRMTICSGRPYPYVEAMIKLIDGYLPGVFEHGCGLYYPRKDLRHECAYHPHAQRSDGERLALDELINRVIRETGAGRQCGKGALVTFFPPPVQPAENFAAYIRELVNEAGLFLAVGNTITSVDVTPRGVDKATGLRWLLDELKADGWEISPDEVAAVGDSTSDIGFMKLAGFAAAPANAVPAVQAMAHYVSLQPYTRGLLDILQKVISTNRASNA
jgi:HAD superfamily hydrolase (TIGR01484 family)